MTKSVGSQSAAACCVGAVVLAHFDCRGQSRSGAVVWNWIGLQKASKSLSKCCKYWALCIPIKSLTQLWNIPFCQILHIFGLSIKKDWCKGNLCTLLLYLKSRILWRKPNDVKKNKIALFGSIWWQMLWLSKERNCFWNMCFRGYLRNHLSYKKVFYIYLHPCLKSFQMKK